MLGIGLAILANSRPYEGFVLVTPLLLSLIWRLRLQAWRVVYPLLVVLLPVAAAMGYYNFRVTGHVLRMPFVEYARIIWARYMGTVADAPAAKHYSGREIWLLTVGGDDLHLGAYPTPPS